jgi:hyperosmotically inducible periplasmic protein
MMKHVFPRVLLLGSLAVVPAALAACGGGAAINQTIDDATITTRVKTALLNDPTVKATAIDVETFGGVVTLRGAVKSKEEEAAAVAVARRINGVRDVKSALQVQ